MGALPKKKHAKARTRTRKAAISLTLPKLVICPNCKELRFPHRACPHCGFYKQQREAKETKELDKSPDVSSTA